MRNYLFFVGLFLLMSCTPEAVPKLQGTWSLISGQEFETGRAAIPGEVEFTFGPEDSLKLTSITKGEKTAQTGFFQVNTQQKPWTMDLRTSSGAQVFAVWEITADGVLHLEHNLSERPRPAGFWNKNSYVYFFKAKP